VSLFEGGAPYLNREPRSSHYTGVAETPMPIDVDSPRTVGTMNTLSVERIA